MITLAGRLAGIDFDFTARRAAVAVLRADAGGLDADRPDVAGDAEQRSRSPSTAARKSPLYRSIIDSSRLPPVWPPRRACSSVGSRDSSTRRASRSLRAIASAHCRTSPGGQHAELVAELTGAAAAVEHRDDGVQREPGIGLEATEQAGKSGAAAETPDIDPAQLHGRQLHWRARLSTGSKARWIMLAWPRQILRRRLTGRVKLRPEYARAGLR